MCHLHFISIERNAACCLVSSTNHNSFVIISAGAIEILGSQNDDGPSTISMFSTDGSSAAILHVLVDRDSASGTCTFYGATSAN